MSEDEDKIVVFNPETRKPTWLKGAIAKEYQIAIQHFENTKCEHLRKELRQKPASNGVVQIKEQCIDCGIVQGRSLPHTDENLKSPPWDNELNIKYRRLRDENNTRIVSDFCRRRENEDLASEVDWQARYKAYRRTPQWQRVRVKVFQKHNGICAGCDEAPAVEIHHLTYSNVGDELLYQLVPLCRTCHKKEHPEHHEPLFYDNDYIPCDQCRWSIDEVECGRFNVKCYEALSHTGECGPTAEKFEGLK